MTSCVKYKEAPDAYFIGFCQDFDSGFPDSRIPGFRILGRMKFCPHTEEDYVTVMLLLFVRRLFP